jgi:isopentenyldiphosphate isomerase
VNAADRPLATAAAGRYTRAITYEDRIRECNNADLSRYVPWHVAGQRCGLLRRDRAHWLLQASVAFVPLAGTAGGLELQGVDFAARSAVLADLAARLAATGAINGLRGEFYPVVTAFGKAPVMQLDRAAVPWFGVQPFGVHLNGYVARADGPWLWNAVRARGKTTFPGCWDNLVAGGQPIGLSLQENLIKECAEEAGISADLAQRARPAGRITYVAETEAGLKPDTLFCYDLELPADFAPVPVDGEVERFVLLPAREVAAIVRDTQRFKPNCNLVLIAFFLRHGLLDGEVDAAGLCALAAALQAPLP